MWLNEDLPVSMENNRRQLQPVLMAARATGQYEKAYVRADGLILDDREYSVDDLELLEQHLHPSALSTRTEGDTTLFWRRSSQLSKFYPCKLCVNDRNFSCVEQYLVSEMARCDDHQTASTAMTLEEPAQMKKLARKLQHPRQGMAK